MKRLPEKFRKCCSEDGSKLAYPGFSVVFLQTFCIHDSLEFVIPQTAVLEPKEYDEKVKEINKKAHQNAVKEAKKNYGKETEIDEGWKYKSLAEHVGLPIVYMYQDIERQIFIDPGISGNNRLEEYDNEKRNLLRGSLKKTLLYEDPEEAADKDKIIGFKRVTKKTVAPESVNPEENIYYFPDTSVHRFSLQGFEFEVPIEFEEDEDDKEKIEPVCLKGHANVEMSLFYGNTVSIAYKFFIDGYTASIYKYVKDKDYSEKTNAYTDHIISFLSCHLGAEFWSDNGKKEAVNSNNNNQEADINLAQEFIVNKIWISEDGNALEFPVTINEDKSEKHEKRVFNDVMIRYKRFLYKNYTAYKEKLTYKEKLEHEEYRDKHPLSVSFDHHYAMVDIWGNVKHVNKSGSCDIFSPECFKLPEREIVDHIRDYHKPELIGLMTLYPKEWKYRDGKTFDYVCGDSVAIDTDDLVLVGTHVAVVLGTYDRRGKESDGNDWKSMKKVKAKFHVAWPEYLLILQFILAKKVVVSRMKDNMIDLIGRTSDRRNTDELLFRNSNFGVELTRRVLMLDVVKYAKFASHRVMYDRTMDRLKVSGDIDEIHELSEMLSSNLQNISNHKSAKSGFWLNIILSIVSIASLAELLYQEPVFKFQDSKYTGLPSVIIGISGVLMIVGFVFLICYIFKKWSIIGLVNRYLHIRKDYGKE